MPLAPLTLAWTRATIENADGVIVAVVERSAVNADHWHLTWMITSTPGPDGRRRAMGDTETLTWADVRRALSSGVPGHVIAAAGATATHDYLRRENGAGGVTR